MVEYIGQRTSSKSITKFSSNEEARAAAIAFLKQQVHGKKLDSKTLQYQREYYADKRDAINQNLYLKLRTKVNELDQSVEKLASKENLSGQMKQKLEQINQRWANSCGKFGDISMLVDDFFTAKYNLEKVLAILRDYENLDNEVDELKRIINNDQEILTVYRKLKMLNYVRMKLIERVENTDDIPMDNPNLIHSMS